MTNKNLITPLPLIGWREYLSLPELGIEKIKAKIDTGAKTSALHAFDVETIEKDEQTWIQFTVHPLQKNEEFEVKCLAPFKEYREIKNSGGDTEIRPVVTTSVSLGEYRWQIELTLTNRDSMGFRMLLGRQAVRKRFLVDSGKSFFYKK